MQASFQDKSELEELRINRNQQRRRATKSALPSTSRDAKRSHAHLTLNEDNEMINHVKSTVRAYLRKAGFYRNKGMVRVLDAYQQLKLETEGRKSSLLWTTHKCASTFISRVFSEIQNDYTIACFDYASQVWSLGDEIDLADPHEIVRNAASILYRKYGEVYGPLRIPFTFPHRSELINVFFLRDPRDVLVSAYYSERYSHAAPRHSLLKQQFNKRRNELKDIDIDRFCLEGMRSWVGPYYKQYSEMASASPQCYFLSYDYFQNQTKDFLVKLFEAFGIENIKAETVDKLSERASPIQENPEQNILQHKRSGRSRQFEAELKSETVDIMNNELADILGYWNFKV